MSYYFRQQQMRKEPVEKDGLNRALNAAVELRARAKALWDESKVARGKTTPESTPGSFAPKDGGGDSGVQRTSGGRKLTQEALDMLKETQHTTYRDAYVGKLKTREQAESYAQAKMKKWMGPGYEKEVTAMVYRIWNEVEKNRFKESYHDWRGPELRWAVKTDIQL